MDGADLNCRGFQMKELDRKQQDSGSDGNSHLHFYQS